MIFFFYSLFL